MSDTEKDHPPATVSVREFFRDGAYQTLRQPTVVTWHGRPIGTWVPAVVSNVPTTPVEVDVYVGSVTHGPHVKRSYVATTTMPSWLIPQEDSSE